MLIKIIGALLMGIYKGLKGDQEFTVCHVFFLRTVHSLTDLRARR